MTTFIFPDGTMIGLDQELCEEYEAETDEEGVVGLVTEILADWGFDGVPEWWKVRYRQAIIEAVIWDGHHMKMGIVHNQRFNEWYVSPEVPYGHVEFR